MTDFQLTPEEDDQNVWDWNPQHLEPRWHVCYYAVTKANANDYVRRFAGQGSTITYMVLKEGEFPDGRPSIPCR